MNASNFMRDRQRPLTRLYGSTPQAAWVTDSAQTTSTTDDPLHGSVALKGNHTVPVALHSAVGGESDAPVPGDILCGALASCLDSTLRVVADRLGVGLREVSITADADVDVRGTLMVSSDVPVAFQRLRMSVHVVAEEGTQQSTIDGLVRIAEQCCVVLQTLRHGVTVDVGLAGAVEGAGHAA